MPSLDELHRAYMESKSKDYDNYNVGEFEHDIPNREDEYGDIHWSPVSNIGKPKKRTAKEMDFWLNSMEY